ncbi:hypothetical protein BD769DRAFT_1658146 [Suillus cothurnatus]|nr:hypothetical protein BD769DRAFT_1658146 [Suillus cothurnatus]
MRASAFYLVVLSVATTLVSSRPSASHLTQSFRALSGPLYKRQSSTPSQCTPSCDPVQAELNDGCPITACCTQAFETSYYHCLLCVGVADNATDYTTAQADIDNLYVACYNYGYSLQELTFPGQNPSRTLSTTSRDITSTITGTSPASVSSPTTSVSAPTSVTSTPTFISQTTILPSSASSVSSGTSTSTNGTATSPTSVSTTSSAALSVRGSGVWALVAAALGLIMLRNN